MDLAKRDLLIQKLKTQKNIKEQFLNERSAHLKKPETANPHLKAVAEEYDTYVAGITHEKIKQSSALQILVDYLNQIMLDPTSTSEIIKQAKYDQEVVLSELRQHFS
jgi:hypothetical protein